MMKLSNKAKRNLSFVLFIIGVLNCTSIVLNIILDHGSIKDWMYLCAMLGFTLFAFAYFNVFKKRVKQGNIFGNSNLTIE